MNRTRQGKKSHSGVMFLHLDRLDCRLLPVRLERWPSGLRQRFAKPSYRFKLVPRVRIPPSPFLGVSGDDNGRHTTSKSPSLVSLLRREYAQILVSARPLRVPIDDNRCTIKEHSPTRESQENRSLVGGGTLEISDGSLQQGMISSEHSSLS